MLKQSIPESNYCLHETVNFVFSKKQYNLLPGQANVNELKMATDYLTLAELRLHMISNHDVIHDDSLLRHPSTLV